MTTVALSLVSHTNVGKTTLARTLLRRDIGEVRDEAHVTQRAESQLLIASPEGHRLELWDTPGFGDSVRLARRLALAGNPLGWLLTEVWDRLRDRPFWLAQHAVRHVFEHADVVLYLVNASESPADAGYLDAELQVLALLGKPVVVLLNQLGAPRPQAAEFDELARWRERLGVDRDRGAAESAAAASVHGVLALDAFARCWVQEGVLLRAVAPLLAADRRDAFETLARAWELRSAAVWRQSMAVLARRLARAARDVQPVAEADWAGRLKAVGTSLGLRQADGQTPRRQAEVALAERLADDVRTSTDSLIALHGLDGRAASTVLARLGAHYAAQQPASEGRAAIWGGVLAGALSGLQADLASGGLTLGGGLLAGGVLGALGAAGLARGYNLVRGVEQPLLSWSVGVLDELAHAALLGYLAVAHFGRGRGDWTETEQPAFWPPLVSAVVDAHRPALHALWARRAAADDAPVDGLQRWLQTASGELLSRLYPDAPR